MIKPTEKTALVTHRNCLDGTGSAAIFVIHGGEKENVFFRDPHNCALSPKDAAPFDEVWFVDVCPKDLSDPAGGKPWRVFDHHETNIRRHGENCPNCTFDLTRCGSSILARALSPYADGHLGATIRELVETIEHYDLGRFEATQHVKLLAASASTYTQRELLDILVQRKADVLYLGQFQNRGHAFESFQNIFIENAIDGVYVEEMLIGDSSYRFGLVTVPREFANAAANLLLDKKPNIDIAVMADFTRNSVSMRAREGGPNLSKIAEAFNGGGHPRAAGLRLDSRKAYAELFEVIFG